MAGPSTYTSDIALQSLVDALGDVVFVYDEQFVCRRVGRGASEFFGIEPASILGQTRAALLERLGAMFSELKPFVASLLDAASERIDLDAVGIAGPTARSIAWSTAAIVNESGAIVGRIDIVRDVTRMREFERKLEQASLVDTLTGLGNLRRFEEECEREHRRAQRAWESFTIARVDVQNMNAVNSVQGRANGDSLLRLLGERLKASRRQYDAVARWENDDFALLLPCVDSTAVKRVLERAAIQAVEAAREAGFDIALNVGVAVWTPPSADSATDVLSRATAALAVAKQTGPGSVHVDYDGTTIKDDPFASIAEPPERVD